MRISLPSLNNVNKERSNCTNEKKKNRKKKYNTIQSQVFFEIKEATRRYYFSFFSFFSFLEPVIICFLSLRLRGGKRKKEKKKGIKFIPTSVL